MREFFNKRTGRWYVRMPDRSSVYRYRLVMEEALGRPLRPDEHVHHINGIKTYDSLDNLQIVSPAEHARIHAPERFAAQEAAQKSRWLFEWSATAPACRECGSAERPHLAKGWCSGCYYTVRKRITQGHQKRSPATVVVTNCPGCGIEFSYTLKSRRTCCSRACAGTHGAAKAWETRRVRGTDRGWGKVA